jgi:murein tripeptide amidase MpaA
VQIDWSFESGSLCMAEIAGPDMVRVLPRRDYDHEGRNWTFLWCYFRLKGAAGKTICLQFLDLTDEWNHRASFSWGKHTRPVYSTDQMRWERFSQVEYDLRRRTLSVWLEVPTDSLWIAYQPPYTLSRLYEFLTGLAGCLGVDVSSLGASAGGRPIPLVEVRGTRRPTSHVWIVCRQHPWETASTLAAEGLLRCLTSGTPEARELIDRVAFHVVPIANPDGVVLGHTRFNQRGYDLNRCYDQATLQTSPETVHLLESLRQAQAAGETVDLLLNIHNNNQECQDLVAGSGAEEGNITRFSEALARHTFFRGRASWSEQASFLPDARSTYILVEMRTGYDPTLERYVTTDDQLSYGAGLAQAIGAFFA